LADNLKIFSLISSQTHKLRCQFQTGKKKAGGFPPA
jgi:hypothetical protein